MLLWEGPALHGRFHNSTASVRIGSTDTANQGLWERWMGLPDRYSHTPVVRGLCDDRER